MNIQAKTIVLVFSLILITGAVTTIVSENISRNMVEKGVYNHLETTVQSKAQHVDAFLDKEKKLTLQLSQSVVIERLLSSNKTDKDYNAKLDDVITRLKNSANINPEIYDIFVLDTNGVVIASNIEERIGLDRSDDPYFINGKKGVFIKDVYFSRFLNGEKSLAISAPVFGDVNNALIGIVVIRIRLETLNDILTDTTGLGETGEIYLVNKDGAR